MPFSLSQCGILAGDAGAVREAVGVGLAVGEGRVPHLLAVADGGLVGRELLDGLPVLAADGVDGVDAVDEVVLRHLREALLEVGLQAWRSSSGVLAISGAASRPPTPSGGDGGQGLVHCLDILISGGSGGASPGTWFRWSSAGGPVRPADRLSQSDQMYSTTSTNSLSLRMPCLPKGGMTTSGFLTVGSQIWTRDVVLARVAGLHGDQRRADGAGGIAAGHHVAGDAVAFGAVHGDLLAGLDVAVEFHLRHLGLRQCVA
jgi:hypothetical protein